MSTRAEVCTGSYVRPEEPDGCRSAWGQSAASAPALTASPAGARQCLTRAVLPRAPAGAPEAVLAGGWQARDACVTACCIISVK